MHNLFLVYFVNLYMFHAFLCPSSGGTRVCIRVVLIILFRWLSVVPVGFPNPNRTTGSHLKRGTTACIQKVLLIILFKWLSVVPVELPNPNRTTDSHLKRIISTSCCIHTVYLLMMGLDTHETCRGWRNILRITCASRWVFFIRVSAV
jgi:hypothetical protein